MLRNRIDVEIAHKQRLSRPGCIRIKTRIDPRDRECWSTRSPARGVANLSKQADMRTILLHGRIAAGRVALVDDEDYDLVMRYRWRVWERRLPDCRTYGPYALAKTRVDGRVVVLYMHKLITGYARTDHIDHNGLNNQRSNLRPATTAQNTQNARSQVNHSSRFKGVTWHRQVGKWQAGIKIAGVHHHLGCHTNEADAARAYNAAALAAWGEYAYLNEVDTA